MNSSEFLYRLLTPEIVGSGGRNGATVSLLVESTQTVLGVVRRGNLVRGNLRSFEAMVIPWRAEEQ